MKIAIHTLGCKVNQYESEAIKGRFLKADGEIVGEEEYADVYIINTCTVTSLADRKSRQYIRRMKKKNPNSIVVVTGCYAQVNAKEVAEIQGVNLIVGNNKKSEIVELVREHMKNKSTFDEDSMKFPIEFYVMPTAEIRDFEEWGSTIFMENRTRAYVKIQEGCNRYCSYCIIPYARGGLRSRREEDILKECKELLDRGFSELVLTGINTALYENLESLLDKLNSIEGNFRIRLSSLEPTVINKDYIKRIFRFDKLCHHLHLSLQSGSDRILKSMNRRYTAEDYLEIAEVLKDFDPLYGITTDIIIGFPGEDENDFDDTMNMVKNVGFCRVHPFKYSQRKGTLAADMSDQVRGDIKKRRMDQLMEVSKKVAKKFAEKNLHMRTEVIFEEIVKIQGKAYLGGYTDNYLRAYCELNAEIDADKADKYVGKIINVVNKDVISDGVLVNLA